MVAENRIRLPSMVTSISQFASAWHDSQHFPRCLWLHIHRGISVLPVALATLVHWDQRSATSLVMRTPCIRERLACCTQLCGWLSHRPDIVQPFLGSSL